MEITYKNYKKLNYDKITIHTIENIENKFLRSLVKGERIEALRDKRTYCKVYMSKSGASPNVQRLQALKEKRCINCLTEKSSRRNLCSECASMLGKTDPHTTLGRIYHNNCLGCGKSAIDRDVQRYYCKKCIAGLPELHNEDNMEESNEYRKED